MTKNKKKEWEFWTLLIPLSLDRKIRKHIEKNNYDSISSFIRTALFTQLAEEKPIDFPLPKRHQKMLIFSVPVSLKEDMDNSTAKINYSSKSDFVRSSIRNQIAREEKETDTVQTKEI